MSTERRKAQPGLQGEVALEVIELRRPPWSTPKHAAQ